LSFFEHATVIIVRTFPSIPNTNKIHITVDKAIEASSLNGSTNELNNDDIGQFQRNAINLFKDRIYMAQCSWHIWYIKEKWTILLYFL